MTIMNLPILSIAGACFVPNVCNGDIIKRIAMHGLSALTVLPPVTKVLIALLDIILLLEEILL